MPKRIFAMPKRCARKRRRRGRSSECAMIVQQAAARSVLHLGWRCVQEVWSGGMLGAQTVRCCNGRARQGKGKRAEMPVDA
eukprot:3443203-Pleurochrysis_carterae.AAC.2